MARIQKDYSNRRRVPIIVGRSEAVDRQKMSGNAGQGAGNSEQVIAHEKASQDRAKRRVIPNAKLGKK